MATLGIVFSHDGTLSIVSNGVHLYSCAEERLNRRKAYIGFPFQALREAVAQGRLTPGEIDVVAVPLLSYPKKAARTFSFVLNEDKKYYDLQNEREPLGFALPNDGWEEIRTDEECKSYIDRKLRGLLDSVGISAPIEFYDHHQCHAASAFYSSGLQNALAITMDGEGDGLSATVSVCEGPNITRLSSTDRIDSAGYLYAAVTKRCGFKMSRHEGKITGLAAYGDPARAYQILSKYVVVVDGRLQLQGLRGNRLWDRILRRLFRSLGVELKFGAFQCIDKCDGISDADLAAGIQKLLEERISEIVGYWVARTGITDVVLAGGIFANVKFNQRISELPDVTSLFVYPDMGDGGTAYGAAIYSEVTRIGYDPKESRLPDAYLGPEFSDVQIEEILNRCSWIDYELSRNVASAAAESLADGKIVGWFQGRMEYGPRALGNRSILGNPTDATINDWLNERMKRTEFMPFAPSCLYEYADELFEIPDKNVKRAAEFMTVTFKVKDEWAQKAPAVSHVDQTARPQLVKKEVNPLFHQLLQEFNSITGLPLVINTSFNVHEEPIVCRPEEALRALESKVIDMLAIGNYIVRLK